MATPRFDTICQEFLKRVPDNFKTAFTPGGGALPDGYVLEATQIKDYVNRALLKLFNLYWEQTKGNYKLFMKIFPELVKFSDAVSLSSGNYDVANPYLDFKALVGAVESSENTFIKVWHPDRYTIALSEEYPQYTASAENPAIIQVNKKLAVFPQSSTFDIKFQYIKIPVDPTTGNPLTQNGSYDSPFMDDWNTQIIDLAEEIYLIESHQTA